MPVHISIGLRLAVKAVEISVSCFQNTLFVGGISDILFLPSFAIYVDIKCVKIR